MSNQRRVIKEKETFRTEQIVNIDGQDVKFYVKSTVNYERLTYKVQPIITLSHGDDQAVDKAIIDSVRECRNECKSRLFQYREDEIDVGDVLRKKGALELLMGNHQRAYDDYGV